jgi:RNA polymerase sigma-54 factor
MLRILQDFDPAGVGGRSLQECLMIQLQRKTQTESCRLAQKMLKRCFDDFTHKRWDKMQQRFSLSDEQMEEVRKELVHLNPRPGISLGDTVGRNSQIIVPDFVVETEDDGSIHLSLNDGGVPELRVTPSFVNMLEEKSKDKTHLDKDTRDAMAFLKQKVDAAQGFIAAVKSRQQTLFNTMQCIIDLQRPFFQEGDESLLRPMILKDVAERAGLDISTISRVSNSKYVQTNFGIYPLKFFFVDGYTNEEGEEFSVREIRRFLKECIDKEDKENPMTDDALAQVLKEKGYSIARRTVAKYRESLGIPVARLRK